MRTATARAAASFPPEPLSVRAARRFLRTFLAEHDEDGGLVDAAQLALSEVATNAVLHAHTPFEVTAALGADGVLRVEVADAEPQLPVQRGYTGQATTGRGMELVAAYTAACGVTSRGPAGKTVWFVVVPDADPEQQPAHAWGVDQGAAASSAAGDHLVVLRGLPPTLWLAAREHHDAVLRELALWAADHPDAAPPPERRALADQARARISSRVVAELERLTAAGPHHALPPDHPSPLPDTPGTLDLALRVGADAASAFGALQDVLDAAESLAVAGRLLARPGLPEVVAVRDWACESVIAQLAGVAPSPWPGTEIGRAHV